jgi:hypothetical protein
MKWLAENFAVEGEQSDMAGALDGDRQLALVSGAGACLAARADFAIVGHIAAQHFDLFVVDRCTFVGAELTLTWASEKTGPSALGVIFVNRLVTHKYTPWDELHPQRMLSRLALHAEKQSI